MAGTPKARSASTQEEELAKEINEQYLLSKKYLDYVHDRMNDQEEMYRCYINNSDYPHNAQVFDPRVFRIIETITPRMVVSEPCGSYYPQEPSDLPTADILNAFIKYDWRRADMFPKLTTFVKSLLIFGTGFGRVYWDLRETEKTRMKAKVVNGKAVWTPMNTEKVEVTEFDGPNFEVLNIYDCFPDPNATSMENMRWFIYRTFKTVDELKKYNDTKGGAYYKNLDILEKKVSDKKQADENLTSLPQDLQYREHRRTMLSTEELKGQDQSNVDIVVVRRFTTDRWVDYVPEYNLIIRDVENPYFNGLIPIIHGVDYPYPGELYGMGEIEPVDRIQRAINAVLNQRLDNVQLTLNTMWKVVKNKGVDLHTLYSAPGNVVFTDDKDAVEPIQIPDVTGSTFVQTMNYLTAAIQNGSGITDYTIGIDNSAAIANKTATGTRLIQSEANAQFKLKIQLFNHMVIQKIANIWKDLRIQYTTDKQYIRIVGKGDIKDLKENSPLGTMGINGEEIAPGQLEIESKLKVSPDGNFAFLEVLPEDIQPSIVGDYDFIAKVSSETINDPEIMKQNFFVALEKMNTPVWQQGLASQGKMINYENLTNEVFDQLDMGLEGKEFITQAPPPPQVGPDGQPQMGMGGQPFNPQQIQEMIAQAQGQAEQNLPINKVQNEMALKQMPINIANGQGPA